MPEIASKTKSLEIPHLVRGDIFQSENRARLGRATALFTARCASGMPPSSNAASFTGTWDLPNRIWPANGKPIRSRT